MANIDYEKEMVGTVDVPEPLQPYMGGREVIEGHEPVGEAAVGAGKKD